MPVSYTNWQSGQPDNVGNQNCLAFNWGSPPGKWDDGKCTNKHKYVCQTACTGHTFADKASLQTAVTEYDSNAAAATASGARADQLIQIC